MLKKLYKKNIFNPKFPFGIFVNPFYIIRRELYKTIKESALLFEGEIVDIGCGSKPYQHLFKVASYIGLDIDNPGHEHSNSKVDLFYDGKKIPFNDNTKDGVLFFEVAEHVFELEALLEEINRVLKPGGKLLLTTPLLFGEHETPNDFGRYTSYGLTFLLNKKGFEIIKSQKTVNGPEVIFMMLNHYLYSVFKISKSSSLIILILVFPFIILNNIFSVLFSFLPRNNDVYFGNTLVARKK